MALFQNSVISKYLNAQVKETLAAKWAIFQNHFKNPNIQENIRNSKEEQYQEGFLNDLFVNVLGYTKNPSLNFNLTTELKNVKDGKKADGGIIINEKVLGVIELKGTNTTDLNKIETQAFGYKNNQPECVYVITSNFEKIRFYIDNAIEYLEFNLFTLSEKEFSLLYLCLAYENIAKNLPKEIKELSLNEEDRITKELYQDYALFKRELYQNLVKLNPEIEPLLLFQKSQKLLDRFLFLFFAEDRNLLPANSIRQIFQQWTALKKWRKYMPLYELYRDYFDFLNTGNPELGVFAYNGGLFKPDETLDKLKIEDDLLYRHTLKLSNYDFASEVDVNILGHIFENSLNELDEIKAQLAGEKMEKAQTKRKKDGVFYTPKYITKYIVENTVGKLCREQKESLNIREEEYFTDKKRSKKEKERLAALLQSYQDWLLQLTILDPACGSGAFLNEALNFLMAEHQYIDELRRKIMGGELAFSEVANAILEKNLFGVDLNEESVEIAKLSLWLRTAREGIQLNDLSKNIKCGNSLIDDAEVAGNKAFNWQKEFPHIFEKGGFDVVIGNPPYGAKLEIEIENCSESYLLFYKKGINLLKNKGILSFITPDSWLTNNNAKFIRQIFLNQGAILAIRDTYKVFDDAPDVWCNIPIFQKGMIQGNVEISRDEPYNYPFFQFNLSAERLFAYGLGSWFVYINDDFYSLFQKIKNNPKLSDFCDIKRGFSPTPNDLNTTLVPQKRQLIGGEDFGRYKANIKPKYLLDAYPKSREAIDSILSNDFIGVQRIRTNSLDIKSRWLICHYFNQKNLVPNDSIGFCINFKEINPLFLLSILNSTLLNSYYKFQFTDKNVKPIYLAELPIPKISLEAQQPFIEKADKMLTLNKALQAYSQKFQQTLMRKFSLGSLSAKLQKWYLLRDKDFLEEIEKQKIKLSPAQEAEWAQYFAQESQKGLSIQFPQRLKKEFSLKTLSKKMEKWYLMPFKDFLEELERQKIKLSLAQEAEWVEYFVQECEKAREIAEQIAQTDKEIDKMVYALYGLTEEEIALVAQG